MKRLILLPLLALCLTAAAQTPTNSAPPKALSFLSELAGNLGNATNWTIAPYATYAPTAPTKYGGGVLAVYNVNEYIGAGSGVDWLGEFNLISANVTLRVPTRPFTALGWSNVIATPFIIAGIGTPVGGVGVNNGSVSTIEGAGLSLDVGKIKGWNFGLGYAYDNWTGVGDFGGRHHQAFVKLSKGF